MSATPWHPTVVELPALGVAPGAHQGEPRANGADDVKAWYVDYGRRRTPSVRRIAPSVVLIVLSCVLATGAARAQAAGGGPTSEVSRTFAAGVEHGRSGRWREALAEFTRAYELSGNALILLNIATARVETGQLVLGAATYRQFLRDANSPRAISQRAAAEAAMQSVERRIATFVVRFSNAAAGDVYELDGAIVPDLSSALPIDPGRHALAVRRDGLEIAREDFEASPGALSVVTISARGSVPQIAQADAHPPVAQDPSPVRFNGGLGSGAAIGLGPSVSAAVMTSAGFRWRAFSAAVELRVDLPSWGTFAGGASVGVWGVSAALVPCLRWTALGACALATLGSIVGGSGNVSQPQSSATVASSLGARALVEFPTNTPLRARIFLDVAASLLRASLRIDGVELWSASPVYAILGAAIALELR